MSESEDSSDEDDTYEGPVIPYMFEPMAEVVAECVGPAVVSAASTVMDVSNVSSWYVHQIYVVKL